MRRAAAFLIIIGVLVAGYPLALKAYIHYGQQRHTAAWEAARGGEKQTSPVAPGEPGPGPIGILHIEKIDMRLPILDGTDGDNLWVGAGLWEKGAAIGEEGHTVITSHHARYHGQLFNRLDEVRVGDKVVIETHSRTHRYVVYDREVVAPETLTPAEADQGESLLTLVTCEYSRSAYSPDRLVVKARLISGHSR